MARIYVPSSGLETWKSRLADPETQWVRGKSAFETAVFWETGARGPRGLHRTLATLLDTQETLRGCELVASFPEHHVALPGGKRTSQTDVWAILRTPTGLVSLAVEGKAGETFAETVGAWRREASAGKVERLSFLATELGLAGDIDDGIRYQLLHRTASALIEGSRIGAIASVMVVASFAADATSKADFASFSELCGTKNVSGCLCKSSTARRPLFLGWLDLPPATDSQIAAVAV